MQALRARPAAVLALCLGLCLAVPSKAAVFGFDTPGLYLHPVPFSETSGGLTAYFDSFPSTGFSVQSLYTLSTFSGNYLWDNNPDLSTLSIVFSSPVMDISLLFATVDYHDPNAGLPGGPGTALGLTAYLGAAIVGSATARGNFIQGDTYPQGMLSFNGGGAQFDRVQLAVIFQSQGATQFFVDQIQVTPAAAAPIPEPGTLALAGAGVSLLVSSRRRRWI